MSPPEGSPPREYRRATYSAPPSPQHSPREAARGAPEQPASTRAPGIAPIAPSKFFSSSSSTRQPPGPATADRATLPHGDECVQDSDEGEEIIVRSTRQTRVRPSPRSPTNPWGTTPKTAITRPIVPSTAPPDLSLGDSDVQIEDSAFPSDGPHSPRISTSSSTDRLALTPAPSVGSSRPLVPARAPSPPKIRPASAQPDCGKDGRWTTSRLLAKEGQGGSRSGIWQWEAYDVEVEETPSNSKYLPMGDWVQLPGTVDGPADQDDNEEDQEEEDVDEKMNGVETSAASVKVPKRGFQTIQRSELGTIRPHPDLFFCCETLSWCLFSKLPSVSTDFAVDGVQLWRFDQMDNYRKHLPPHESIRVALYEDLTPPLPYPLSPSEPESLRTAPHYTFPPRQHASLCSLKLSFAASTKQNRVLFSSQQFYPSVLGQELWKNLLDTRGENPQPGQTPAQAKVTAVNFVWRAVDDALFKGETRALPIEGRTFKKSMPWDDISLTKWLQSANSCDIFLSVLGYSLVRDGTAIQPPSIDGRSTDGAVNRKRLLRAWLELGIWLQDQYTRANDTAAKRETRIKLRPAQVRMAEIAGGDDLSKIDTSQVWTTVNSSSRPNFEVSKNSAIDPLAAHYSTLGCTPDLSDESILRVFETQMRTWPANSPEFLEALIKISTIRDSECLSTKIVVERSKGKYARSEIDKAYAELRLPASDDSDLIGEDELSHAFDKRLSEVEHPERRKVLKDALNLIAQHKQSEVLQAVLISLGESEGSGPSGMQGLEAEKMDPDRAYRALEIDKTTDDEVIAMVYEVRVSDAKDDTERKKMAMAVGVIAEERNSDRLRAVAKANEAPDAPSESWQLVPTADRSVPVGLTNIANTCYLNSLLQYFFTVRELREAVLAFTPSDRSNTPSTSQIRVGGRLVSESEIQRSRRFVLLLQTLFQQLTYSTSAAITPETELAYLALVPGKDEAGIQDASEKNDDRSTGRVVDDEDLIILDPPENVSSPDKDPLAGSKSPSVLGKRTTDEKEEDVPMSSEDPVPASSSIVPPIGSNSQLLDTDNPVASDSEMAEAFPLPPLSRSSSCTAASLDERHPKRGRSVDQSPSGTLPAVETSDRGTDPVRAVIQPSIATTLSSSPAPPPLPPRPLLRDQTKDQKLEAQVSDYMAFGRQNDVTECMDNVMFQVEAALQFDCDQGTGSLLKRIFFGKNRQKLVFQDAATASEEVRTQEDPFFSLLVDVPPSSFDRDVYDGLDTVFDDAPVEIDGRLAQRSVSLLELPPILQIQLQRVQYDREKGRIFKSNAHLRFPDELSLARYLEVDESDLSGIEKKAHALKLRLELERSRMRLAKLEQLGPVTLQNTSQAQHFKDALDHFAAVSEELGPLLDPSISEDTANEVQALETETASLRQRTKDLREALLGLWDAKREHDYELRAVFIHRGTASCGHYYIFQRDSRDPNRWLKYNDSLVSSVDRDEIFRETMSDSNAYFLVYCRKDSLIERFEFLLRDGLKPSRLESEQLAAPRGTTSDASGPAAFEQQWRAEELRRLTQEGVPDDPPHIRAATYRQLLDLRAPNLLSSEYANLVQEVENRITALATPEPHQPLDQQDKLLREIERDVGRTFASLAWFGSRPTTDRGVADDEKDDCAEPREDVLWRRVRALDDLDERIASELSASASAKAVEREESLPAAPLPSLNLSIPSSVDSSSSDLPPSPDTPPSAPSKNRPFSASNVPPSPSRSPKLLHRPTTRREALLRPLFVYAFLNPGVSYVQGMSYLAAVFFYVFSADPTTPAQQVEAETFFAFGSLVSQLQDLYVPALDGNKGGRSSTNGLEATIERFKGLLLWLDPTLAASLERKHVEVGGFILRWSTTIFASEFSLPDLVRVWDRVVSVYPQGHERPESLTPVLSHILDLGLAVVITNRATFISPYSSLQKMYNILQAPSIEGSAVDKLLLFAWDIRERRLGRQTSTSTPLTPKSRSKSGGALTGLFKQRLWSPSSTMSARTAEFELDTNSSLGDSQHTSQSLQGEGGRGFGSIAISSPRSSSGSLANNVTMIEGKLLPPPPARMKDQETIASLVEAELDLPEYGVEDDREEDDFADSVSAGSVVHGWLKNSVSRFASSDTAANLSKRATNLQLAAVHSASTTAARFQSSDAAAQLLKAQTNLAVQAQLLKDRVASEQLTAKVKEAGERFLASKASDRGDPQMTGPQETPFTPPTGSGTLNPPSPSSSPGGPTSHGHGAPRPLLLSSSARRAHNGSVDEPSESTSSSRRSSMVLSTRSPSVSPVLSRSVHLPLLSPDLSIPPLSRSPSRGSHGRSTSSFDTPSRSNPAANGRPRSASQSRAGHVDSSCYDEEPLLSGRFGGSAPSRRFGGNGRTSGKGGGSAQGWAETSLSGRKGWTLSDAPVEPSSEGPTGDQDVDDVGAPEDGLAGLAIHLPSLSRAAEGLPEASRPVASSPFNTLGRHDTTPTPGRPTDPVAQSMRRADTGSDAPTGPSEIPFVPPIPETPSAVVSHASPPPEAPTTHVLDSVSSLPPPPSSHPSLSRGAKVVRRPPVGKNRSSRGSSIAGSVDLGASEPGLAERRIANDFLTRSASRGSDRGADTAEACGASRMEGGGRLREDVEASTTYDESLLLDS
ncbi:hypothetical protein JCM11491_006159 [Sporobolomyces phaffii]